MLIALAAVVAAAVPAPIAAVVRDYQAAMEARSVEKLAAVMDKDLVVLEGTHKNTGWADYRDNHIGPEMRDWSEFRVLQTQITDSVVSDRLAYVAVESTYRIVSAGKPATVAAAETFVMLEAGGKWRIRHLHFSAKKLDSSKR